MNLRELRPYRIDIKRAIWRLYRGAIFAFVVKKLLPSAHLRHSGSGNYTRTPTTLIQASRDAANRLKLPEEI